MSILLPGEIQKVMDLADSLGDRLRSYLSRVGIKTTIVQELYRNPDKQTNKKQIVTELMRLGCLVQTGCLMLRLTSASKLAKGQPLVGIWQECYQCLV